MTTGASQHRGWIERGQVLLGTLVTIGVRGLGDASAHAALDAAFAEVADVHRLMSFHDGASDVGRLNRHACRAPVSVDARTLEVLAFALELSAATEGAFDVAVAPRLVSDGVLPPPGSAPAPDPLATWRDIEIRATHEVAFRRPLWIDLGGIAKGYAVDRAMQHLPADARVQRRVNAGGDLRVAGPDAERVLLKVPGLASALLPMIEIADGSVASSATALGRVAPDSRAVAGCAGSAGSAAAAHFDGRTGAPVPAGRFASVVAERCMVADALTKVVLALDDAAQPVLARYGARAHVHDAAGGWRTLGATS